jgi:hypothetical protein
VATNRLRLIEKGELRSPLFTIFNWSILSFYVPLALGVGAAFLL